MGTKTKAFQAWGTPGNQVRDTPRAAALAFFEAFPKARKCTVSEGETDGFYFTFVYSRTSQRYTDITRKNLASLPDVKPA